MRKVLSLVVIVFMSLGLASCGQNTPAAAGEAPELLRAVPADALAVGVFTRCDNAVEKMLDSTDVLRSLDYGKLSRHKAVIALCDVGSVSPLLIIETGKATAGEGLRAATDTLPQTATLAADADSMRLFSAQLALSRHNVLLLTNSATLITVVSRHLSTETSILDAPHFDGVLELLGNSDAVAWRNSGAGKLFNLPLCSIPRKQVNVFLKNAAEWTVATGDKMQTVQPQAEQYFCNFLGALDEGQSKLGASIPPEAELVIDLPIANVAQWRQSYETLMDARVELESYNKRIQNLKKASGKNPLDWEKELGIQEVAYVATKDYCLNFVRCAKKSNGHGVQVNPASGYVRALYGEPFNPADSCCIRHDKWLVSGPREVLDTLTFRTEKGWPAKATAVVQASGRRLTWTKENISIWNSTQ